MGRKRNPWVRLYTKILQSADYMEAPLHVRVAWIAILCHASDMCEEGKLISGNKPLDEKRLARLANITPKQAGEALKYLYDCGMLEIHGGVFCVANWDEYQKPSDNSAGRVVKHRELKQDCNGDNAVSVTVQEEEVEKDKEAERLAELLDTLINDNMTALGYKKKLTFTDKSVSEIEKLHRIDGVAYYLIERVIRWCQSDSFWKMNILSGAKLRKQFPRLLMQMDDDEKKSTAHTTPPVFV